MKLKTLKDLEFKNFLEKENPVVYAKELKQEAIQWAKAVKSKKKVDLGDVTARPVNLFMWIKYFFNITEEDLTSNNLKP